MNYMLKLFAWNEELALEFLQTLRDGFAIVRGERVSFSPKIVENIIEFPLEGEQFSDTLDTFLARSQFIVHIDPQLQID